MHGRHELIHVLLCVISFFNERTQIHTNYQQNMYNQSYARLLRRPEIGVIATITFGVKPINGVTEMWYHDSRVHNSPTSDITYVALLHWQI